MIVNKRAKVLHIGKEQSVQQMEKRIKLDSHLSSDTNTNSQENEVLKLLVNYETPRENGFHSYSEKAEIKPQ